MKIAGKSYRTIWPRDDGGRDHRPDEAAASRSRPHAEIGRRRGARSATMIVRGAPLIGATAAYGIALAMRSRSSDAALDRAYDALLATRPTAVNLRWALARMRDRLAQPPREERARSPGPKPPRSATRMSRPAAHRRARPQNPARAAAPKKAGRPAQRPHPLQCRLARLRRLGHGAGADLHGA
jgi:hypothetical protein